MSAVQIRQRWSGNKSRLTKWRGLLILHLKPEACQLNNLSFIEVSINSLSVIELTLNNLFVIELTLHILPAERPGGASRKGGRCSSPGSHNGAER